MKKFCRECNNEFDAAHSVQQFCGRECYSLNRAKTKDATAGIIKDFEEVKRQSILGVTRQNICFDSWEKDGDDEFIRLVPWGDVHVGAPEDQCVWEKAKAHLDFVLNTPHTYLIGMGDYMDCAQKMQARGPNVHFQSLDPQRQFQLIFKALKPLAEQKKILGLHSGNHEGWIMEGQGIQLVKTLCDSLDVEYLGPGCDTTITVGKQHYSIYSQHGISGARHSHTKMAALKKATLDIFSNLYLMGHVHVKTFLEGGKRFNGQSIKCYYALTGHFLDWEGSYAQLFGYDISPAGCMKIKLFADRWDVHVEG